MSIHYEHEQTSQFRLKIGFFPKLMRAVPLVRGILCEPLPSVRVKIFETCIVHYSLSYTRKPYLMRKGS